MKSSGKGRDNKLFWKVYSRDTDVVVCEVEGWVELLDFLLFGSSDYYVRLFDFKRKETEFREP
jgi:hypothetical protein